MADPTHDASVLRDFADLADAGHGLATLDGQRVLDGLRMVATTARDIATLLERDGLTMRELLHR